MSGTQPASDRSPTPPDRPTTDDADTEAADEATAHLPPLDLADTPAHARHPEEYTAMPGSHRQSPEGPALDVGG